MLHATTAELPALLPADLDTGVQQTAVVFALQQLLLGAQTEDSFAASGMDVAMVCANSVVNATGYQGGAVEGAFTGAFAKVSWRCSVLSSGRVPLESCFKHVRPA